VFFKYTLFADQNIYIAGQDGNVPCYWVNGKQVILPTFGNKGHAISIALSNDHIYVLGEDDYNNVLRPCYWIDSVQYLLQYEGIGATAASMVVVNNHVYIAGNINSEIFKGKPCYWVDGKPILLPINGISGAATSITMHQKKLFISGFDTDGYNSKPCYWIDEERISINLHGVYGWVDKIIVSSDHIYLMGIDQNDYCYWIDDVQYSIVNKNSGRVHDMVISNSNIYFVGRDIINGQKIPCYWYNGVQYFLPLNKTTGFFTGWAGSIVALDDHIYIAGYEDDGYDVNLRKSIIKPCYWIDGKQIFLPFSNEYGMALGIAIIN
jgi:hypothetical protein